MLLVHTLMAESHNFGNSSQNPVFRQKFKNSIYLFFQNARKKKQKHFHRYPAITKTKLFIKLKKSEHGAMFMLLIYWN